MPAGAASPRTGTSAYVAPDSRPGPARGEVDLAALALIERHEHQIMATARRYASTPEDAEDAYQRGLEIMLTKAPTTREDELVPWLRTVVKHEAFALRRQRERATPTTDDGELGDPPTGEGATHEQAERRDRLRMGAEALRRLKPQEVRALRLKAEGYSYREICRITGWTYTKVNRCLTEGRRAFLDRVAGIERGAECERLEPLLSALADGEAGGAELLPLRTHLKTCLACRARLRQLRGAAARAAALAPPAVLAAGGPFRSALESLVGAAQHKAAVLGERLHTTAELATGQKVAAVAASTAAIAGGGATVERLAQSPPPRTPAHHARVPAKKRASLAPAAWRAPQAEAASPAAITPTPPEPKPPAPAPTDPAASAGGAPQTEFAPGARQATPATTPAKRVAPTAPAGEFGP